MPRSCHVTVRFRCTGACQARRLDAADSMSANRKSTRKIILTGGWTARTGNGRVHPVTTGSYLASEFSGSNSAVNLKDSISGQCPMRTQGLTLIEWLLPPAPDVLTRSQLDQENLSVSGGACARKGIARVRQAATALARLTMRTLEIPGMGLPYSTESTDCSMV